MKKVGIISIRGLPPRYGAFEQTVDQLIKNNLDLVFFYVGCEEDCKNFNYSYSNVLRIFTQRRNGIGVIFYGLICFLKIYRLGVRKFIFFGYGLSPLFIIFRWLNVKIICNVDGFEWRRAKWGFLPKLYFRLCEKFAAKYSDELIYDSIIIKRYYAIQHRVGGSLIYYGCEQFEYNSLQDKILDSDYYVVVMRLEPENNILMIVNAFIKSHNCNKLLLIGPATNYFYDYVYPVINTSNGRVVWYGPEYDRNKLAKIRYQALGYVHGHSVGGTNPTLVEACAIGKPIVSFASSFNKKILGSSAYYFLNEIQLTYIFNNDISINPPKLNDDFSWGRISQQYEKLI